MKEHKGLTVRTRSDFIGGPVQGEVWKRAGIDAEPELWRALQDESRSVGCSLSELVRAILGAWVDGRLVVTDCENSKVKQSKTKKV